MTEAGLDVGKDRIERIEKLELDERWAVDEIENQASYEGLLPCFGSDMDISRFYPPGVSSAIRYFTRTVGGEGPCNVEKRLEMIHRFTEIYKPLVHLRNEWEIDTKLSSDLVEQLKSKGDDKQKDMLYDFLSHYSEKRLETALEVGPNLREQMIHLYALSESMRPGVSGIQKVLELTTFGKGEEEKVLQRVNLYAEHGSKIPSKKLAGLSKEEILRMHEYDAQWFEWDVRELFAKYVRWEDWEKAKDLAALALKTYTALKKKSGEDSFRQKDVNEFYVLWEWTCNNFNVLKKEISFIKGSPEK